MPHHQTKIATCCYCGTRAALVLRGASQHRLSCASCGAPITHMKQMPMQSAVPRAEAPRPAKAQHNHPRVAKTPLRKKKRKSLARKVWEEAWDVVEDIFD